MALFPEALAKNRTDSKAEPVRSIFDMVVDFSVRVGLAEITWSFFSSADNTSKKRFLTNYLPFAQCARSSARDAEAELDEASAKGLTLVLEWAWV
jgi:hypothetical protein